MRILISGGTVVSPTGTQAAEVLVDGERIVALAAPGSDLANSFAEGARRVDASGRLVIPGAVDVHTHMEMPFGGTRFCRYRSRPGPGRQPGEARLPSWTSRSSAKVKRSARGSTRGIKRRKAIVRSTTGST